jgi:steroid delta-isomerase
MQTHAAHLQIIVDFFEGLTPAQVGRLGQIYADDASFEDPFNQVSGLQNIQRIFAHMYVALQEPRFVVTESLWRDDRCMLLWDFNFRFKGGRSGPLQTVHGCSHLTLGTDGRILVHRDYWDPAAGLYEKLPVLGGLMRWLRRRMTTPG